MTEQLLTTILTVIGTIAVALSSGFVTYAVASRQAKNDRDNRADELEQARTTAVHGAQQQVVDTAIGILGPLKEQNDWLTRQVHDLQDRLADVEARLKIELGEKARLLRENAELRSAYNVMGRKVEKLERFIRANIGRDIDTDELDTDPNLGNFTDPPPPASPNPNDWQ